MDSFIIYGLIVVIISSFFWGLVLSPIGLLSASIITIALWYFKFIRPVNKAKEHVGSGALGFGFFFLINMLGLIVSWIEVGIIERESVIDAVIDVLVKIWTFLKPFVRS